MRFKKIYIEITNLCNFSCSFCCKTVRRKKFVSPEEFSAILFKIKPYTNYLYLHVLGEPLLHPQLETLLSIAHESGFFVNITTNGSLIAKKREILTRQPIRQFNISLHDAEENISKENQKQYLYDIFDFAGEKSNESYFSFRLWNQSPKTSLLFNRECVNHINDYFGTNIDEKSLTKEKNIKIKDHIFLQNSVRFSWPGEQALGIRHRTCYALKDHVAILVDGTVVPCCLDADAQMSLGNVFDDDFYNIIHSEKAKKILSGFQKKKIVENFCQDCGFILL